MAAFTVATFAASGSMNLGGQSFTPNVPGPDGTGSPGTATSVIVTQLTVGYASSDVTSRSYNCYIYSVELDDPSEVGQSENLVSNTNKWTDGSAFGTNTYTRTYAFNVCTLDPTQTYYIYFDDAQYLRYKSPAPYTGGNAWDEDFDDLPYDAQFQVDMTTP